MTTTTEPTVSELDEQLESLDNARVTLTSQRDGIVVELAQIRTQWSERAAVGDVDGDATAALRGLEGALVSLDTALELNGQKRSAVQQQRDSITGRAEVAAKVAELGRAIGEFNGRPDEKSLVSEALAKVVEISKHLHERVVDLEARRGELQSPIEQLGRQGALVGVGVGLPPVRSMDGVNHFDSGPFERDIAGVWHAARRTAANTAESLGLWAVRRITAGG